MVRISLIAILMAIACNATGMQQSTFLKALLANMIIEEEIQITHNKTFTTYKTEFNGVRSTLTEIRNQADNALIYGGKTYGKDQSVLYPQNKAKKKFKYIQTELTRRNPYGSDLAGDTTARSLKDALNLQ